MTNAQGRKLIDPSQIEAIEDIMAAGGGVWGCKVSMRSGYSIDLQNVDVEEIMQMPNSPQFYELPAES